MDNVKFLRIALLYNTFGGYRPTTVFDQKLSQNVPQIIISYHVTKQFLSCLN